MDQAQLIEARKIKLALLTEITDAGKSEKRKLSTVETRTFETTINEIEAIDAELAGKSPVPPLPNQKRNMEKKTFSLLKAIRSAAEGTAQDAVAVEVINAGQAEMRKSGLAYTGSIQLPESRATIAALATNSGIEAISEQKMGFIEPLRSKLICVEAGATFLTGLVGDVSMPSYAGSTAAWKGEVVTAVDGAGATAEVTLSPKRLTCFIDISKQFLAQDSINAEAMLMADIVNAISDKLESTIFGKAAGSSTQPAGFFYTAPAVKGSVTWANVVALETAVDTNNALTTAKYITNAAGRGILKAKPKVTAQALYMIEPDGTMNGYPVLVTNNVATGLQTGTDEEGIIFGNFAHLLIGQWGAIDLTVDPYTQAALGTIRIVINAYFDAVARRSVAFKTGSIKA